jgi:hypothetical protein
MTPQMLAEAQRAVTSALRFQGNRMFQEDVAKGMAPEQALLKNGSNIFAGDPTGLVNSVHMARMAQNRQAAMGPIRTAPVLDEEGNPRPNMFGTMGPSGSISIHTVPKRETEQQRLEREAADQELKAINERLAKHESDRPMNKSVPRYADWVARKAELQKERADFLGRSGAAAVSTTKAAHRAEGLKHLKANPTRADAIRKRFKDTYGEDLETGE